MPGAGGPHGRDAGLRLHRAEGSPNCAACRGYGSAQRAAVRKRAYLRAGRPVYVDPTGTRRRICALAAIGWSYEAIGAACGRRKTTAYSWTVSAKVEAKTAALVIELYDLLSMTPGPSRQARELAARKGWPPPLAWDDADLDDPAVKPVAARPLSRGCRPVDEMAVHRAMTGRPAHLTPAEALEVVRRLTARGLSAGEIAERMGTTQRSVVRRRAIASERTA